MKFLVENDEVPAVLGAVISSFALLPSCDWSLLAFVFGKLGTLFAELSGSAGMTLSLSAVA